MIEQAIEEAEKELNRKGARDAKESFEKNFVLLASSRLLSLKICDPACGSGHFLIAAAHRIARRLAEVRAGGDEPTPIATRSALREVIAHCIYGVDVNPMAVELCKVNLWLESIEPGKPLSFLDAHIKCGNSLVGVGPKMDLDALVIPDEAFKAVTGDEKAAASAIKKRNKAERAGQLTLELHAVREDALDNYAERLRNVEDMPEDNAEQVRFKEQAYQALQTDYHFQRRKQQADLWTAAFFWTLKTDPHSHALIAPTQGEMRNVLLGKPYSIGLAEEARRLANENRFFHWTLEFVDIFKDQDGFDCVIGNPPWERIKLQEQEYFAARDPEIARAANKAAREKLIKALPKTNPALALAFEAAKHEAEAASKFVHFSTRFPLTAVGDVNTYALFAENERDLMAKTGRVGIIVPTGIATDDTTKDFFCDLVEKRQVNTLFDFENREALFSGVHRSYKFCLLTLSGEPVKRAEFIFFATNTAHLRDEQRRFHLAAQEIALFNPNTRTMPIFRTRADAELTRYIYERVPVLVNERTGENPWGISFLRMFDMSNDSNLFVTEPREGYVPLYEGKMIWHFDHRFGTYEGVTDRSSTHLPNPTTAQYADPEYVIQPWYWVARKNIEEQIQKRWENKWFLSYRRISNASNERTMVSTIVPKAGITDVLPLQFTLHVNLCSLLLANYNSLYFDYVTRQKIGGLHIDFHQLRQFPVLPLSAYKPTDIDFIAPRVLELVYTAYDLKPFADDLWGGGTTEPLKGDEYTESTLHAALRRQWEANREATGGGHAGLTPPSEAAIQPGDFPYPPFMWDEERRAVLRAELDAYYARLYGLNRKQIRYILDPHGLSQKELEDILDPWEDPTCSGPHLLPEHPAEDFPGETFRVLKEKEIRKYGEYRTRRLVLEAWERLNH